MIRGICYKCEPGYLLVDHKCIQTCGDSLFYDAFLNACRGCPEGCAVCEYPGSCSKCVSEYTLAGQKCVLNCPEEHFVFRGQSQECRLCPEGCSLCDSQEHCRLCKSHFYLSKDKRCERCPQNCLICFDQSVCLLCVQGFELIDSSCRRNKLISNWENRFKKEQMTRVSQSSTSVDDQVPLISLSNRHECLLYSASGHCFMCRPGYFRKEDKCEACSEGCMQCDMFHFCIQCKSNFKAVYKNGTVFCELKVVLRF